MKKMYVVLAACLFIGCQKAELQESKQKDARSIQEEMDSVEVKPVIESKGWEGSIDVGFEF